MVKEVPIEFKLVNLKIEGWQLLLDFSLDYSVSADNISLLAVNRKTKAELPAFCERIDKEKAIYRAELRLDALSKHVEDKGCIDFYVGIREAEADL